MAGGQILGGNDYGQNEAGTGVGAYVPGDENTHENQAALEKVAQRNAEYQKQKADQEEKELNRRRKSTLDIQVDPSGIRPIDKEAVLNGQDLINKYVTQAYADDRDPFDPKNANEYQKLNGMLNAHKVLVNTSSALNKQIGDETKQYQNDKGLNYHPDSEKNLRKANTISLPDYLKSSDPDVGLGKPLLKPADKYDFNKDMTVLTAKQKREWAQQEGSNTVRYEGTDSPAQISDDYRIDTDKKGNKTYLHNDKPITQATYDFETKRKGYTHLDATPSGKEILASQMTADPNSKMYKHLEAEMAAPENEPLARQAQIQSDKNLEETGKYVPPIQYYAQYRAQPWLTKGYKNSHEDADAAASRKVQVHAANKAIDQQKEEELGMAQYHRVQNSLAGKGQTYYDQDGNKISADLTGEKVGVGVNADGKQVPVYITKVDVTDPEKVKVYTNLSEESFIKKKAPAPYIEMPKSKFIQDYMSPILKNNGSKDVSSSWKGVERAGKKEFEPGLGYNNTKYLQNTYGEDQPAQEEVHLPTAKSSSMLSNVVDAARNAIAAGKKIVGAKEATQPSTQNKANDTGFTPDQEAKIKKVMDANKGATREDVIKALKDAKKL